jgi:hypothetical protein
MSENRRRRPSAALIVASLSLFVSLSGVSYAATGHAFVLGTGNLAGAPTRLTSGTAAGPSLKVTNTGGRPAATFVTAAGKPPFAVTQSAKVALLNADRVDGISAEQLERADVEVPAASVSRSSTESAAAATGVTATLNTERYDTAGMADLGTDNQHLTAPKAGMYVVSATVEWDPNGAGYRRTDIVGANNEVLGTVAGPPTNNIAYTIQNVSGIAKMAAGDKVHVEVLQGSGAALAFRVAHFTISYVGR